MIAADGLTLLATVCNTTPNAVPFALWMARGKQQWLVDLSDALNKRGDQGLTGLAWHQGRIYAAVQSSAAPRILVLDRHLAVVGVVTSPFFEDLHSLHIVGDALIAVSTGRRSVVRIELAERRITKVCGFEGALHVNSALVAADRTLVCCHSAGQVLPEATSGGVLDVGESRIVIDGLEAPHSLMPDGTGYLVLDSGGSRVIRFDDHGVQAERELGGFLRGCCVARESLYVAGSTRRVISRKNPDASVARSYWEDMRQRVRLYELDAATLTVKAEHHPLIAGFEVYELVALEAADAPDPPAGRMLEPDPHMLTQVFYEAAKFAYAELHRGAPTP